jgi:hypothetical protein
VGTPACLPIHPLCHYPISQPVGACPLPPSLSLWDHPVCLLLWLWMTGSVLTRRQVRQHRSFQFSRSDRRYSGLSSNASACLLPFHIPYFTTCLSLPSPPCLALWELPLCVLLALDAASTAAHLCCWQGVPIGSSCTSGALWCPAEAKADLFPSPRLQVPSHRCSQR